MAAFTIIGFSEIFGMLGVGPALIQRVELEERYVYDVVIKYAIDVIYPPPRAMARVASPWSSPATIKSQRLKKIYVDQGYKQWLVDWVKPWLTFVPRTCGEATRAT